jgi:outer membrane protein TolC
VSSANNLYAAIQNEDGIEKLMAKTKRLYDLREVTDYAKTQVESDLARVKGDVESARVAYIRASDALQPLLDGGHDVVYLPIGYTVPLSEKLAIDPTQVRRDLVKMNPQLQSQEYNVKSAAVLERQAQQQLRPDFTFAAGVQAAEIGSTFGYHDWWQSTSRVVNPDIVTQSYSLNFTRPWGNRLAKSRYQETQYNFRAAELGVRATENSLTRSLTDAAVGVLSARARTEITGRSLGLAQTAYDKAVAQQQTRGVTEYEIIQQSNNLLAATRDWIAAVIDAKQAEARWYAARGDIAAKYAEWTAQTITDDARVKALAAEQVVPLFAPEKKDVH